MRPNISSGTHALRAWIPDLCAAAALAVFIVLAAIKYPLVRDAQDVVIYGEIADRVIAAMNGGGAPIDSEYPPLATSFFWLVRQMMPGVPFAAPWLLFMCVAAVCAWAYLRCFSIRDAVIFAVLMPACVLLLGHDMIFSRFDFFVVVPLLLSWRTYRHGAFSEAAGWLCTAVFLKLVPVIVVPVLFFALPRRAWMPALAGSILSFAAAAVIAVAVLGWDGTFANVFYVLSYHGDRVMQLETTWSGIGVLLAFAAGHTPHIGFDHMSVVNFDIPAVATKVAKVLILASVLVVLWRSRSMRVQAKYGQLMMLLLCLSLVFSPVLSPQYFVWVVPLLLFAVAERIFSRDLCWPALLIGLSAVLLSIQTQWIFPYHYNELVDMKMWPLLVLNMRNGLLVLVCGALAADIGLIRGKVPVRSASRLAAVLGADTFFVAMAIGAFVAVRPFLLSTTTPAYITVQGQSLGSASMPVSVDAPEQALLTVRTSLQIRPFSQDRFFRIRVDDCLESVMINDRMLPEDAGYCDGVGPGRVYDFGDFVRQGSNSVTLNVRNKYDGPVGVHLVPVMTVKMFALLLALAGLVGWYTAATLGILLHLQEIPAAARALEMLYNPVASWKKLRSAHRTSSIGLPQTAPGIFI